MKEQEHETLRQHPLLMNFLGISHTLLCAGVVFGWSSLESVLIAEGVFSSSKTPTVQFSSVFTLGAIGNYLSNLPFGYLLDTRGAKVAGMTASVMFAIGIVLVSFSVSSGFCLYLGFFLLGFCGPGIQLPTLQLSALLTGASSVAVMSFQAAAFDGGSFMFYLTKIFYSYYALSSSWFFRFYLIAPAFAFFTALTLWPTTTIEKQDEVDDETHKMIVQSPAGSGSPFVTARRMSEPEASQLNMHTKTLSEMLRSTEYIFLSAFVAVHILKLNFIVASVNGQFVERFEKDDYEHLIWTFGWMLPLGFLVMPVFTHILHKSPLIAFQLANVFGLIYGYTFAFGGVSTQLYVTFPLVAISRQLVYSIVFQEIAHLFGFTHYGLLLGITNVVVAVVGLLQYGLMVIADANGSFDIPNILLLMVGLPLFLAGYFLQSDNQQPATEKKSAGKKRVDSSPAADNTEQMSLLKHSASYTMA